MKKMVIFTTLFFNKVGNQSMLETVKQYSKHYDVYIITSASARDNYYLSSQEAKKSLPNNVFFFRQSGWFKDIFRFAISFIRRVIPKKKNCKEVKVDNNLQNLNYSLLNIISFHVSYFSLFLFAGKLKFLGRLPSADYICGYEIGGVTPAIRYRNMFNRKAKLFSKMQGTILYDAITKGIENSDKNYTLDHSAYSKLRTFDLVCMTNDGTYGDIVLEHYGIKPSAYLHIMNGISEGIVQFSNKYSYKKLKSPVIKLVTVSRLVGWKRVYLGIELLNILINIKGREDFTFDIYGHGNEAEIIHLENLIEKYSLQKHVTIKGQISHDKVASVMTDADFIISLYKMTNVTNPLLEAMFLNVPIITLADSSLLSIVKNDENKNRYIFEEIDEDSVINQIADFLVSCDVEQVRQKRFELNNTVPHELMTWEKRINTEVKKLNSI